jgi:hypothetical protein
MVGRIFVPDFLGWVCTDFHPADRVGERLVTGLFPVADVVPGFLARMMFVAVVILIRQIIHIKISPGLGHRHRHACSYARTPRLFGARHAYTTWFAG